MSPGGWASRQRPLPLRSALSDCLLAGFAVYAAWTLTSEVAGAGGPTAYAAAAHALAFLHGSVVALRRLAPLWAVGGLLVTAAPFVLVLRLPVFMLGPAVLFVAYAVGSELTRRRAVTLLGAVELSMVLLLMSGSAFPGWDSTLLFAGLVAGSWFLGLLVRRWRTLAHDLAARATELEAARTELARHSVAAERLRIARELHDVVAHSMSVVAMHAGVARLAVGTNSDGEAAAALEVIERSSRDALAEMRRLVTVLRDDDAGSADMGPAPGVAELHTLVSGVVDAGVTVDVRTDGDLTALPPGVSLVAYRVVQEALTNVVRHAGATRARLEVRVGDDAVSIRVEDEGPAGSWRQPALDGSGHGTIGMRERLELYGGTLSAGPRGGGWSVEARLPFEVGSR